MFERLMQLPLFHGAGAQQLTELVEKIPFHFLKYRDGEVIAGEGDKCTHLRFIVSGEATVTIRLCNLRVSLAQDLAAPDVLAPDYLFGLDTAYPFSVKAKGECGVMQLRKADYVTVVQSDKVFLFNILNYLSLKNQRQAGAWLGMRDGSVRERLALLLATFTGQTSRHVTLDFVQKDLCALLSVQRSTLIQALEELRRKGLIRFTSTQIAVIDLPGIVRQDEAETEKAENTSDTTTSNEAQ